MAALRFTLPSMLVGLVAAVPGPLEAALAVLAILTGVPAAFYAFVGFVGLVSRTPFERNRDNAA